MTRTAIDIYAGARHFARTRFLLRIYATIAATSAQLKPSAPEETTPSTVGSFFSFKFLRWLVSFRNDSFIDQIMAQRQIAKLCAISFRDSEMIFFLFSFSVDMLSVDMLSNNFRFRLIWLNLYWCKYYFCKSRIKSSWENYNLDYNIRISILIKKIFFSVWNDTPKFPFSFRDFRSETLLRYSICRYVSHVTIRYNTIRWLHYGLCHAEPPLGAIRSSLPVAQIYRERRHQEVARIRHRWLRHTTKSIIYVKKIK